MQSHEQQEQQQQQPQQPQQPQLPPLNAQEPWLMFWHGPRYADHHPIPDSFLIRSQSRTRNMQFMMAPAVLQHYIIVRNTNVASHLRLDISKFCGNSLYGKDLLNLLEGRGGDSLEFFRSITQMPYMKPISLWFSDDDDDDDGEDDGDGESHNEMVIYQLASGLIKYGPALLSEFVVDAAFMDDAIFPKIAPVDISTKMGTHAMLLIGMRRDPDCGYMFMLQNWWEGSEFVEISLAHFKSANPRITFITSNEITSIPTGCATLNAVFSFCRVDAGGDHATPVLDR